MNLKFPFENLNEFEKIFIYIDIFENHIKKGGFDAFFRNSAGQFSHEILEAYERIGALETASIIYDSFLLFNEIPIRVLKFILLEDVLSLKIFLDVPNNDPSIIVFCIIESALD